MINTNEYLDYAVELLSNYPYLDGVPVVQSEAVNGNENIPAWLGVYPASYSMEPRATGGRWQASPAVRILAQVTSGQDGSQIEKDLTKLVNWVIAAITADINGWKSRDLFDAFTEIRVDHFFRERDDGTIMFREAEIIFTGAACAII